MCTCVLSLRSNVREKLAPTVRPAWSAGVAQLELGAGTLESGAVIEM